MSPNAGNGRAGMTFGILGYIKIDGKKFQWW
jgi:hypothetical protein